MKLKYSNKSGEFSYKIKRNCRSRRWRKKISEASKRAWKTKEYREKMHKALKNKKHKHHIDLDHNNDDKLNILILTNSMHQHLHRFAYHYLLKKFGIEEVRKYIKWFFKNYKRERKII